jgi:hypothetical protein
LTLILLALARLYLGLEWLSGALMGILLGLVWTLIVGIAYRQRALQPFSAAIAGLIFYGSVVLLLGWQAKEHVSAELATLQTVTVEEHLQMDTWWESGWRNLPQERPSVASVASRQFNVQAAANPDRIAAMLSGAGWERVPASGWLWMLQALNPEPDEASLPLLGRAFRGRSEALLMRRVQAGSGQLMTLRLWDSGVRLEPGGQILYLAQVSEEHLVQRLGLFSYWRSAPYDVEQLAPLLKDLGGLEQKPVSADLLLLRAPVQGD